jgi:hypothetical protein
MGVEVDLSWFGIEGYRDPCTCLQYQGTLPASLPMVAGHLLHGIMHMNDWELG